MNYIGHIEIVEIKGEFFIVDSADHVYDGPFETRKEADEQLGILLETEAL